MEKSVSTDQLIATIEKVRTARAAVRALGPRIKSKEPEIQRAHSVLALAESELREAGAWLGIRVTLIEKEPERDQVVCARTLKGYTDSE